MSTVELKENATSLLDEAFSFQITYIVVVKSDLFYAMVSDKEQQYPSYALSNEKEPETSCIE